MTTWINAEEYLPPLYLRVLVTTDRGKVFVARRRHIGWESMSFYSEDIYEEERLSIEEGEGHGATKLGKIVSWTLIPSGGE